MFTTILVFGASNSYGAWDKEGGWVSRLRKFLETEKRKNYDDFHFVYNLGISGNTTKNLIERFEFETRQRLESDTDKIIFIFDIGKNDAAFVKSQNSNWVSLDDFKKNIIDLIGLSRKFSKNIIFLGLISEIDEQNVNPWQDDLDYYVKDLREYNKELKEICEKESVIFIDVLGELIKESSENFLDEDGLHLNSQGHQKIFEIVKESIVENKII